MSTENKLPEIDCNVAHPQAVWFNEHWRPVIEQLKAELEKVQQDKASNDSDYLKLSAENNSLKSKIKYANDEIHTLKNKLLVFEGMTFSENQEIAALKSKLEIAKKGLRGLNNEVAAMIATHGDVISQDYGRTNLECLEHRLGIARQALKEIEG